MRRALVVESGATPHVLTAARALDAGGWEVGVAVTGPRADRSRAIRRHHRVPAPEQGLDAFIAALADVVEATGYDLVFGGDDIEVLALSARRDALGCIVPHGPHADVVRAIDKLELTHAATRAGLSAPATRPASDEAFGALRGPVVVKARLHWEPGSTGRRHALAALCATRAEAEREAHAMREAGAEPLLQEPVGGELMALTTVVDRDGLPVAFAQQRSPRLSLRRTSCRAETVAVDSELAAAVTRLLADLRWFGLANLQFLRPPGGEPQLIDLNGRFYGSLALSRAAGLNLPDLWARLAVGDPVPSFAMARAGVRFQALAEDLRRARAERRGSLARDVTGCLAYAPGATHARASWRDPRPTAAVLRRLAGDRVSRGEAGGP